MTRDLRGEMTMDRKNLRSGKFLLTGLSKFDDKEHVMEYFDTLEKALDMIRTYRGMYHGPMENEYCVYDQDGNPIHDIRKSMNSGNLHGDKFLLTGFNKFAEKAHVMGHYNTLEKALEAIRSFDERYAGLMINEYLVYDQDGNLIYDARVAKW